MRAFSAVLILLAVATLAIPVQAVTISTTASDIWTLFPKSTQGENGIWLQARDDGTSNYRLLSYSSDYAWVTPGAAWSLPAVTRMGPGKLSAHPTDQVQVGHDRDTIIRVLLEGSFSEVRVTGRSGVDSSGGVVFSVFTGAGGWTAPLWQRSGAGTFDLLIPCTSGTELFFQADAGANDYNDWARWYDLQVVGTKMIEPPGAVPEPLTMAGLGLGLGAVARYVRRRTRR
jgi:hypothetical protein